MPQAKKLMNEALFEATLAESGVDAVVCLHPKNLFYSTGYPMALSHAIHQRPSGPRSGIAVFSPGGQSTLIVGGNEERVTRETTWIADIRVYSEYVDSPMDVLADVLSEKGAAGGKIGLEKEYFSAAFYDALQGLLPQAAFVAWDEQFDQVRAIKTPEELAIMKRNADILDDLFLEMFQSIKLGDREKEVQDRLICGALQRGAAARASGGILQAGQKGFVVHSRTNNPIERGQIICTDYTINLDGYNANQSRVAVVGPPNAEQKQIYETIREIHFRAAETLFRPGTRACDVFFFCQKEQEKAGLWHHRALLGHNMGIWTHEDPMLVAGDQRELKKGMVVVLEPRFFGYHIQDTFLVTDDKPVLLSDKFNTDEMFVVG
jgi:Xaa-Pro aminopeptidase